MDNGLGISFAPTTEQSEMGDRTGGLEGIPQAIRVLSLRMPRFAGSKAPAPGALLNAQGGQGFDPFLSALMQTLAKTLAPGLDQMQAPGPFSGVSGGMPSTNAGPGPGAPRVNFFEPPKDVSGTPAPMPGGGMRERDPAGQVGIRRQPFMA